MWSENDAGHGAEQRQERAMRLTINGQGATVSTAADLRPYWQAVRGRQFSDVWLACGEAGPALVMLVNNDRAWLMYQRDQEGDPGLSSRNPDYAGPPNALMEFVFEYSQGDEYPIAWTLPVEQAMAACEYFVATQGGRSSEIVWHDDAENDAT
jgi:hypothetical protein